MPEMHGLWRKDAGKRPVVQVALQLRCLRFLLPAEEQGPGLSMLRQGVQAFRPEGDDAMRHVQKVSPDAFFC